VGALYSRFQVTVDARSRGETLEHLRVRLVAWACQRLDRSDAEDLTQDVLVLLTTKYAQAPEDQLLPIALGIAWKLRAARWRKVRRRGEHLAVDAAEASLPDVGRGPEEAAEIQQLTEQLRAAIRKLSGRCRELMRLKLEERTFPEIAEILRAKLGTVYSWDHRCLQNLREQLATKGRVPA
jgi:RNA polymerase sigma factor (sigma-70 family)